jgi:hypothetical protein
MGSRKEECSTAGGSSACVMATERRHIAASILHLQSIGSNHLCGPKNGLSESDSGSLCCLRRRGPQLAFYECIEMDVGVGRSIYCVVIADTIFARPQRFARNAGQFRLKVCRNKTRTCDSAVFAAVIETAQTYYCDPLVLWIKSLE